MSLFSRQFDAFYLRRGVRPRLLLVTLLSMLALVGTSAPAMAEPTTPASTSATPSTTGVVSGQLLDGGAGVAGATAQLVLSAAPGATLGSPQITDADGRFRITAAFAGQFKLKFVLPGGLVQWYPSTTDVYAATVIVIAPGTEYTANDTVVAHASLAGHITTYTGAPAPNAYLELFTSSNSSIGNVRTDANGAYLFAYLPAGTVKMRLAADKLSAPVQWAHGHTDYTQADLFTLTLGTRSTFDEQLLPLGEIVGSFLDNGQPVASVGVRAQLATNANQAVLGSVQADGKYHLWVFPGQYKMEFSPYTRPDQWAHQKDDADSADVFNVVAGDRVVVDEQALPIGRAEGVVTRADGTPGSGVGVYFTDAASGRTYSATTDSNGAWFLVLRSGTYHAEFEDYYQSQWAHGKTSEAAADPIVVNTGQTTTVNETMLAPGKLVVTAVDATTGEAVQSFCATADGLTHYGYGCTETGTLTLSLSDDVYTISVDDQSHIVDSVKGVSVSLGQTTNTTVRLPQPATVQVSFVDARTGATVTRTSCLTLMPLVITNDPFLGRKNDCATNGHGTVTMSRIPAGDYAAFARPNDEVHGDQWVGQSGGTGNRAMAKTWHLRGGTTTNIVVRLDGRGSIAGVVTDRATGKPVYGIGVYADGSDDALTATDETGAYVLDNLGPYAWPLLFVADDYGRQWSGATASHSDASTVRVRVGQTSSYNYALRQGATVTGTVLGPDGKAPVYAAINIVNAGTLDVMGQGSTGADGTYSLKVFGPQKVKVLFEGPVGNGWTRQWYRDADTFTDARTVSVPNRGTVTVNATLTP